VLATEPVGVPVHFHHAILVWAIFYVGQILHAALQIDSIAKKSGKLRRTVFSLTWVPLAFRVGACTVVFGFVFSYPTFIPQIAKILGHPLGPDESSVLALPVNNALALAYGMFLDSVLGYIPFLKSQLPDVNGVAASPPPPAPPLAGPKPN
jgi:hypothetical protein